MSRQRNICHIKLVRGTYVTSGGGKHQVAIPTAGDWNPRRRELTLSPYLTGQWAARGSGSKLSPAGYWLPSGAAHMNILVSVLPNAIVYFNEDITFGQIYSVVPVLGVPIPIPSLIVDWTMSLLSDGSWERTSTSIGLPEPDGNYVLRHIVNGEGKPGPYYDDWVKARGGQPFHYIAERLYP
eukprot:jgi/Botrbrau1/4792/Bobra.0325s0014.1